MGWERERRLTMTLKSAWITVRITNGLLNTRRFLFGRAADGVSWHWHYRR